MATKERLNLPRGIRVDSKLEEGRPLPHFCEWRIDRKRKTKWFATIGERDKFAVSLASDVRQNGIAAFRMDPNEVKSWRAFRAQLGEGVTLDDVLTCWLRHGVGRSSLTVEKAIANFTSAKTSEGVSPQSLAHYGPIFDRFSETFGRKSVSSIDREEVARWLDSLKMADASRRSHFARVRSLFSWLKINRLVSESPCIGIRSPKILEKPVEILTVEQARSLFANNKGQSPELLGRLALEAFAGLRFTSASTVIADDIKFEQRGIELPAATIKTRRREFIDKLPANLWKWLEFSDPKSWGMTPRQYLEAKSDAFTRARVPHPHNCLRHSFATYHVAAHSDPSRTSVILCHTTPKTLWRHYKGVATEVDGKAYFAILP